jgi:hypothetical protein
VHPIGAAVIQSETRCGARNAAIDLLHYSLRDTQEQEILGLSVPRTVDNFPIANQKIRPWFKLFAFGANAGCASISLIKITKSSADCDRFGGLRLPAERHAPRRLHPQRVPLGGLPAVWCSGALSRPLSTNTQASWKMYRFVWPGWTGPSTPVRVAHPVDL